jgi:hypothetical protein
MMLEAVNENPAQMTRQIPAATFKGEISVSATRDSSTASSQLSVDDISSSSSSMSILAQVLASRSLK